MKMKKIILGLFATGILFTACKKKFDLPPTKAEPAVSGYITIDSIVNRYGVYYTGSITPTKLYRFSGDVNLVCTVTADETSGNIYKTVFVEDATGSALTIKLLNSGGLLVGDKIRINLNNVVLNDYGGMVQLDSIDIEKRVVKISSGNVVTPTKLSFDEATLALGSFGLKKYQARLIMLDSVEFSAGDKAQPYADAINKFTLEKTLISPTGNSTVVRNSGYANFAASLIPCGKGSIVAILGEYNGTTQLTLRDHKEVKLSSGGCPLNVKSFNDASVTSGGWSQYNVTGVINWTTGSYNDETYGYISNFVSGNQICETWLISPSFNISSATNPRFSFTSAYNYSGPALEVLVSTNYISGNPTAATWTPLSPTLSPGSWNWTNSGIVSLSAYMSANTRIAFKYTGTGTSGSTWEIDDIAVFGD